MRKKFVSIFFASILLVMAFVGVGCAEKPDFTIVPEVKKIEDVELGEPFKIPAVKVLNKRGDDVTADAVVIPSVLDPNGEDMSMDEDVVVPKIAGTYNLEYVLYGREDITATLKFKTKDTQAPSITTMQRFENDVFLGDKCYLPVVGANDYLDVAEKKVEVFNADGVTSPEVHGEGTGRYFIADSKEGYVIRVTLKDSAGNTETKNFKVRVTEKWAPKISESGLVDYQLATFDRPEYLNNVKAYGEGPTCNFELKTTGIPAADAESGYGSEDGKVLSITPADKRERSFVRIWLPNPIRRADFGSVAMKVYANEAVASLWIQNGRSDEPEGSWDGSAEPSVGGYEFGKWAVLETSQYRFWEKKYADNDLIEYLDLAVWFAEESTVDPILYIDEIFYDMKTTNFIDSTLEKDVIMDFDDYNLGKDGTGAGVAERGYEDTIKIVYGEGKGNLRYDRYFLSADDPEITENVKGTAKGGVLKLRPKNSETEAFLMFPTEVSYDPSYMISIRLMVKKATAAVNLRGYGADNAYHQISFSADKLNEWYEVKVPMTIFAQDAAANNNVLKGMLFYIAGVAGTDQIVYIDEIRLVEPVKTVVTDFKNPTDFDVVIPELYNNKVAVTHVSGSQADQYSDGAIKLTFDPAKMYNAQAGVYLNFAAPIVKTDLQNLIVRLYLGGNGAFLRVYLMSGKTQGALLNGCNADWATVSKGQITLRAETNEQLLKDIEGDITGLFIEFYPNDQTTDNSVDPPVVTENPVDVFVDGILINEQILGMNINKIEFNNAGEYTAETAQGVTGETLTGSGDGYADGAYKAVFSQDATLKIRFTKPISKENVQLFALYIKTDAQINFLQGYLLFGDGSQQGDNLDPLINWTPTQAGNFVVKADNDARLGKHASQSDYGDICGIALHIAPGASPVNVTIDKVEWSSLCTIIDFNDASAYSAETAEGVTGEVLTGSGDGYVNGAYKATFTKDATLNICFAKPLRKDVLSLLQMRFKTDAQINFLQGYLLFGDGSQQGDNLDPFIEWKPTQAGNFVLKADNDARLGKHASQSGYGDICGIALRIVPGDSPVGVTIDCVEADAVLEEAKAACEFAAAEDASAKEPIVITGSQAANGYVVSYERMGETTVQRVDILLEATKYVDASSVVSFGITLELDGKTNYLNAYLLFEKTDADGNHVIGDPLNAGGWGEIGNKTVKLAGSSAAQLGTHESQSDYGKIVGIRIEMQHQQSLKTNLTFTELFYCQKAL